jgi:GxxExxY protein
MAEKEIQKDFLHPELSYQIIGFAFSIYNQLGFGHLEKTYCSAFEEHFKRANISYKRELYFPVKIFDKTIAKEFFDFLVEDKIILEIKVGTQNYRESCSQIFRYLKSSN